ncbi:MAG: hypothetical protein AAFY99_08275 [Pseudomonadota bacterium]
MRYATDNKSFKISAVLVGLCLALAACQTGTPDEVLNVDDAITEADLVAYCPRPTLLEGTAILREYTDGNDDNPDEVVYQASITDVTRSCRYRNGQLFMQVAAAGRVLNGPKGTGGQLNLPIRVAVRQGESIPYSTLGRLDVTVIPGAGATQFIYKDEQIVLPEPTIRNLVVLVGFDEGPYNTP